MQWNKRNKITLVVRTTTDLLLYKIHQPLLSNSTALQRHTLLFLDLYLSYS